jgi:hypothetical protein
VLHRPQANDLWAFLFEGYIMRNTIGVFLFLPLIIMWWVFGLTLIFAPSLLCLLLWVVAGGVIVEYTQIMERSMAEEGLARVDVKVGSMWCTEADMAEWDKRIARKGV